MHGLDIVNGQPRSNLEFFSEFQVATAFGVVFKFGKPDSTNQATKRTKYTET